jgi:hypothetical protein
MDSKQSQTDFVIRSLNAVEDAEAIVLIVRGKNGGDIIWFANDTSTLNTIAMLEFTKLDVYRFAKEQPED